jgi:hypothetical protein
MMTKGEVIYLAMTIGMFVVFAGFLAYYSWQQSRMGPDMLAAKGERNPIPNAPHADRPFHGSATAAG